MKSEFTKSVAGLTLAAAMTSTAALADIDLYANNITLSNNPVPFNTPTTVSVEVCNAGSTTVESTNAYPVEARLFSLEANLTTNGDANDVVQLPSGTTLAQNECTTIDIDWTPSVSEGSVTNVYGLVNPTDSVLVDTSGFEYFDSNSNNDLISTPVAFNTLPPAVPNYPCEGFLPPLDGDEVIVINKKNKRNGPFKANFNDEFGVPLPADATPPVLVYDFTPAASASGTTSDAILETGASDDNEFTLTDEGHWKTNFKIGSSAGQYKFSVISGDPSEYTIEQNGSCQKTFIRQP